MIKFRIFSLNEFLKINTPAFRVFESEDKEKAIKKYGSDKIMKSVSTVLPKEVGMSEDGGKSFKQLLQYEGVHPDHHAWYINPNDPNFLIDGNDGGLNISRDMGKNWHFIDNIPVGQFYHINVVHS